MAKRKRKNTVLGLDLGTYAVKAVEISRVGDELSVTGYSYEPVPDISSYEDAIKDAITAGAFRTNKVVVGFSGRSTLLQVVSLPASKAEDLDAAVMEEAEKYIPYDISEAQIDYHVLDSGDSPQIKLLLSAVRQQDIEDRLEILFNAGVVPTVIDVELVAMVNGFEAANQGSFFAEEGSGVALVNLGAAKTLIAVTDGTTNLFREFPVGGVVLTEAVGQRLGCEMREAEQAKCNPGERLDVIKDAIYPILEEIAGEVRSAMDSFTTMGGKEPRMMLAQGGGVAFAGAVPLLGRLAKVEAKIFDSFGAVTGPDVDDDFLRSHAHEFPLAFGMACHAQQ